MCLEAFDVRNRVCSEARNKLMTYSYTLILFGVIYYVRVSVCLNCWLLCLYVVRKRPWQVVFRDVAKWFGKVFPQEMRFSYLQGDSNGTEDSIFFSDIFLFGWAESPLHACCHSI